MPKYTIERQYLMPVYQHVVVEAASPREACEIALGIHPTVPEPEWTNDQYDVECSYPTEITRMVEGEADDPYQDGAKVIEVPLRSAADAEKVNSCGVVWERDYGDWYADVKEAVIERLREQEDDDG